MKKITYLFFLLLFLSGCATQPPPAQVNVYTPEELPPNMVLVKEGRVPYAVLNNERYAVRAALYEYKNIYVAEVSIKNKTKADIATKEYSILLVDGRDRKPLVMMPLEDLKRVVEGTDRKDGGSSGLAGAEQRLSEILMSVFMEIKPSDARMVRKGLDLILERYFSFRPLWAGEAREGLIVYSLDFRLEYPIRLVIDLKGEKNEIVFVPSKDGIEL